MSNKVKFNIPESLLINKNDIICFNNYSFFVNLSDYELKDGNSILIKKIDGQNKYKFIDYDPFVLILSEDTIFLPIQELYYMRKYNNLVNIHFRLN